MIPMPLPLRTWRSGSIKWVYFGLSMLVVLIFYQVHDFGFVNFDDQLYVFENQTVLGGLSLHSLRWAFSTGFAANWHPVTWLSHLLDVTLFGPNPGLHHGVNVMFHVVNTCLLFHLFRTMTREVWPSAILAALFAVHPTHVESVVWVSERKDVLSTFFGLLTLLAYHRYTLMPSAKRYLVTLCLYAIGLMAKPMLVSLPILMLGLDYWPLGRFPRVDTSRNDRVQGLWILVREKVPFIGLAFLSSVVTFLVQREGGTVAMLDNVSFVIRWANALIAYVRYLGMLVWPMNLSVIYPYPSVTWILARFVPALIVMVFITAVVHVQGRTRPYLRVGWWWFVITMLPVIGLVQVGPQALADRYTYLPFVGLFIVLVWLSQDIVINNNSRLFIQRILWGIVILFLMVLSWIQVGYWRDSVKLFQHALKVTTKNHIAHMTLGKALRLKGMYEEARDQFEKAIQIDPKDPKPHFELGQTLNRPEKKEEALIFYFNALALDPNEYRAAWEAAHVLMQLGRMDESISYFKQFIALEPLRLKDDPIKEIGLSLMARNYIGIILCKLNRREEACFWFWETLHVNPKNEVALNNLGISLSVLDRHEEAIGRLKTSLELFPPRPQVLYFLANSLAIAGKLDDAETIARNHVRLFPADPSGGEQLKKVLKLRNQKK